MFGFAVAAFVVSSWLVWRLASPTARFRIIDEPNDRSLHTVAIPRTGGLGILGGLVVGSVLSTVFLPIDFPLSIAIGMVVVAIVSFRDDCGGVQVGVRFTVHVLASLVLLAGGLVPASLELPGATWDWPTPVAAVITILFTVWMINLYNFMDGMDGFAGGMALIGFTTFAVFGWFADKPSFALASLLVASSSAGFLVFNFPPARIFMGDTGSSTLGFLAAGFTLWAARDGIFPLWLGLLIFSPFVVDATVTLLRRVIRRDKIWVAHKTHYYQRVVQLGWGHKKATLIEYLLMLGCVVSALYIWRRPAPVQLTVLFCWACSYFALMRLIDKWDQRASIGKITRP